MKLLKPKTKNKKQKTNEGRTTTHNYQATLCILPDITVRPYYNNKTGYHKNVNSIKTRKSSKLSKCKNDQNAKSVKLKTLKMIKNVTF